MKALADGSDLEPRKRLLVLSLQGELRHAYHHHLPPGTLLFRCTRCKAVYPLNCFHRNHQRRYGLRTMCRWCRHQSRCLAHHEPQASVTQQRCATCKTLLPIEAFHIDRSQPDGYAQRCRTCCRRRVRRMQQERHVDTVSRHRREQTIRLCAWYHLDVPDHDLKRCQACGRIKHVDQFVNTWNTKDRKKSRCLDCHH